jgi:phospholipase/lecithinase/hemolysin
MQKQILATGVLLLSFLFPLKVLAQKYDEIYVFGDSFSDTGNVFKATGGAIPPSPYYQGRFSNGPIWVEYLTNDLGLTSNPTTNFAIGGATTRFDNIGIAGLPGLQQEIKDFTAAYESADPKALYIVWAGTNDYLDYLSGGVPNPTETVTNLATAVTALAADGAKNIMVANLLDLGKLPGTRVNSQISGGLSTLTSVHNSDLTATLDDLSQKLSPVNIIPLNVNYLFNRFFTTPREFGFTDITDSCLGNSVLANLPPAPSQPEACHTNPNQFLFWDSVHPTTAADKLLGDFAFSTLEDRSVPEPSTGAGVLAFGALGTLSLLKRNSFS